MNFFALLSAALAATSSAFQIQPVLRTPVTRSAVLGHADDLMKDFEKEWETTLEIKFPHARKYATAVSINLIYIFVIANTETILTLDPD